MSISVAESCTGGQLAAAFVSQAGASDFFLGGIVTYSTHSKIDILKIDSKKIKPKKMCLLVENPVYKPFRYPWCYDAWLTQQRIHWLPEEVPLGDDVRDWQKNITPAEKNLLTHIFSIKSTFII